MLLTLFYELYGNFRKNTINLNLIQVQKEGSNYSPHSWLLNILLSEKNDVDFEKLFFF